MEEKKDMLQVPFAALESAYTRYDLMIKRMVMAIIIVTILLFVSNAVWLYAWMQYDYSSSESVTVDGKDGVANYIGNDGEINNGTNNSPESEDTNSKNSAKIGE